MSTPDKPIVYVHLPVEDYNELQLIKQALIDKKDISLTRGYSVYRGRADYQTHYYISYPERDDVVKELLSKIDSLEEIIKQQKEFSNSLLKQLEEVRENLENAILSPSKPARKNWFNYLIHKS